jgi:hypothetical protein
MSQVIKTEGFRSVAGSALTGTLANVGVVTASPARVVMIFNGSDDEVIVSWDNGVTEGFLLPATSSCAVDCSTNKDENNTTPFLPVGSQFQSKHNGSVPTTGNLSITVIT